jgi:hypothetical protein
VDLVAVGADRALAEQRIVGRRILHLGDDGPAVGIALQRGHRLEVMQHGAIDAGLHHRRHIAL